MVQINFALREVNCKIVYYGPGLSGKTTNLEIVHKKAPEANKGELTSIATEGDRTLFFDFMPLDLGTIAGMRTRFQLYTVPGQVYYNSTRKLVLQGVDGIVFVADSSESKMEENLESLENLKNNLAEYGKDVREIPLVLQYNKRDLPDALGVDALNAKLNPMGVPFFEAVAITGEGVFPTLKCLSGMVLETLNRDHRETSASVVRAAVPAPAPAQVPVEVGAGAPATGFGPPRASTPADVPPRPALARGPATEPFQPAGPARPAPRPASAGLPAGAAGGLPPASSAPSAGGGSQQSRHRKVDATPLQQPIRSSAGPVPTGPRRVEIQGEKRFPWALVGLAVLIAGAAAAIVASLGTFGGAR
jgi:signal recognition particle receptor subunit beta